MLRNIWGSSQWRAPYFYSRSFNHWRFNMEGNRDESEKCLRLATKYLKLGDKDKAIKFLNKAEKLYPSQHAKGMFVLISLRRGILRNLASIPKFSPSEVLSDSVSLTQWLTSMSETYRRILLTVHWHCMRAFAGTRDSPLPVYYHLYLDESSIRKRATHFDVFISLFEFCILDSWNSNESHCGGQCQGYPA